MIGQRGRDRGGGKRTPAAVGERVELLAVRGEVEHQTIAVLWGWV